MKRTPVYSFLALLAFGLLLKAQRYELGMQLGMSNLVGDVGRTNYILQKPFGSDLKHFGIPFYGGIIYRMNFNPYQTMRINLGYSNLQFDDARAKELYRSRRGYRGSNSAVEADALFEYNFLPVNTEQKSMLSPFIFGGIGAMLFRVRQYQIAFDFKRGAAGQALPPTSPTDFNYSSTIQRGSQITMAVPFGVGLKYKFKYNWVLSGEFTFRPTFSDGIDYSNISDKDINVTYNKDFLDATGKKSLLQAEPYLAETKKIKDQYLGTSFGNLNSKDWVNSVTLGLTYSFGRPPCYCE